MIMTERDRLAWKIQDIFAEFIPDHYEEDWPTKGSFALADAILSGRIPAYSPADDLVERLQALVILDEVESDNPLGRKAAAALTASRAEVERLTRERNEARDAYEQLYASYEGVLASELNATVKRLVSEKQAADAKITELTDAKITALIEALLWIDNVEPELVAAAETKFGFNLRALTATRAPVRPAHTPDVVEALRAEIWQIAQAVGISEDEAYSANTICDRIAALFVASKCNWPPL